jgi:hypothetical protein
MNKGEGIIYKERERKLLIKGEKMRNVRQKNNKEKMARRQEGKIE